MTESATTRGEAHAAIRESLQVWKDSGVEDPTIAVYTDSDGDGEPDVFGLNAFGALEIRHGVKIEDTVSVSNGTGVEQP